MRDILLVIDMQNDFIDGALGTAEAVAIVENVAAKVKNLIENNLLKSLKRFCQEKLLLELFCLVVQAVQEKQQVQNF